jgi:predicted Zn-dependent protease
MLSLFHRDTNFKQEAIPSELLRLLIDVGYVATGNGKKDDAEVIFESVVAARPNDEQPYILYSFMRMVFGEYAEAAKLLVEKALKINPGSDMARTFYGMLLYQVGRRGESNFIFNQLKENGKDEDALLLVERILQEG